MVKAGGALLVQQHDLSAEKLAQILGEMLGAPAMLQQRAADAHGLAAPDAAMRLADLVDRLGARAT